MHLKPEDLAGGRVGVDARGMRFIVLDGRNMDQDGEDRFAFVAVLPGSRYGVPGTCLSYSWVEMPVSWDGEAAPEISGELKPSESDLRWREFHGLNPDGTSKTATCEGALPPTQEGALFAMCGKPAAYALRLAGPEGDIWADKALCPACGPKYAHQGHMLHILHLRRPGSAPAEDPRLTAAKAQGCCGRMALRGPSERCHECPLPRG